MRPDIQVLPDMIEAFDKEQPKPGRETSAFIKRWRRKELDMPHRSDRARSEAVRCINHAEIESIRRTKWARDAKRVGNNRMVQEAT